MITVTNRLYQRAKWVIADQGYGSVKTLASKTGMSDTQAKHILGFLVQTGFLHKMNFITRTFKIKNQAKG